MDDFVRPLAAKRSNAPSCLSQGSMRDWLASIKYMQVSAGSAAARAAQCDHCKTFTEDGPVENRA